MRRPESKKEQAQNRKIQKLTKEIASLQGEIRLLRFQEVLVVDILNEARRRTMPVRGMNRDCCFLPKSIVRIDLNKDAIPVEKSNGVTIYGSSLATIVCEGDIIYLPTRSEEANEESSVVRGS